MQREQVLGLSTITVLKTVDHALNTTRWFAENADDGRWAEKALGEIKRARTSYFSNTYRSVEEANDQLIQAVEWLYKYVTASEAGRNVSKRDLRMANKIMNELVSIHEFVEKSVE